MEYNYASAIRGKLGVLTGMLRKGLRFIANTLQDVWQFLKALGLKALNKLKALFSKLWSKIKNFVAGKGKGVGDDLAEGAGKGKNGRSKAPARDYTPDKLQAIAEAKALVEANDAIDTPVPVLLGQLQILKKRWSFIKRFDLRRGRIPGSLSVWMIASEIEIDPEYTIGNRSIQGLRYATDKAFTAFELKVANFMGRDGRKIVLAGDKTIKQILKLPDVTMDFISVNQRGRFVLTEVKGSLGESGAQIAKAVDQITAARKGLLDLIPNAKIGKLEVAIPKGGHLEAPFLEFKGLLVKDVQEGLEIVKIAGQPVHILRVP